MSSKAICSDNAVAESLFSVLKEEFVHHKYFASRLGARAMLFE
jgi:transposase InsO family protein